MRRYLALLLGGLVIVSLSWGVLAQQAGGVTVYVVQRGDTLSSIARLYHITYPTLQRANCMGSSTTIYSGQLLWVPNIVVIIRTPTPYFPSTFTPVTPTSYP